MSTKLSAGRVRSTYEFIKANRAKYSVQGMRRVLGVAPSGTTSGSRTHLEPGPGGCPPAPPDPCVVHRESGHLRRPSRLPGFARGWRDL